MDEAKSVKTSIAQHFKLSSINSPTEDDFEHTSYMRTIPYSSAIGSIMYLMVCSMHMQQV